MKCPKCNEELIPEQPTLGCEMYVAEDDSSCVAWADGIDMYRCSNNHRIYISQPDEDEVAGGV